MICPKCLRIVEELVHDSGERICAICSGKNYWNVDNHSNDKNLERCKETLGEKMVKLNQHVADYYRHKLFNLNSKDKNKFEGY
jgi:hypothetical protein